jgi:hypothetical protein
MARRRRTIDSLNFTPLANGLDYLHSARWHLKEDKRKQVQPSDLKYAVLHLYAAIEVLIKARLMREHWALVVSKPDGVTKEKFDAGDFHSINTLQAFDRLAKIGGVPLTASNRSSVEAVEKLRNRLQHFGLEAKPEQVISITAQAFNFVWDFLNEHSVPDETEADDLLNFNMEVQNVREDLQYITGLVDERMGIINSVLDSAQAVVACPYCPQEAWVVEARQCKFCLAKADDYGEDPAAAYINNVKGLWERQVAMEGGTWPGYRCPGCGDEAFVSGVAVRGKSAQQWLCFSCILMADADELLVCDHCREPFRPQPADGLAVCYECRPISGST